MFGLIARAVCAHAMAAQATFAAAAVGEALPLGRVAEAQLAIVVNRASRVDEISLDQLRRVYLGQSQSLPGAGMVSLVIYTPARASFAQKTLGLPESALRQRWIGILFRAEAPAPPVDVSDPDEVKQYVRNHPDALAFLPAANVDATIKVLRVNGKMPTDANYPIR